MDGFPGAFEDLIVPGMQITEKCTFPLFFQTIYMDSPALKAFGGPQTSCSLLCLRIVVFDELSSR